MTPGKKYPEFDDETEEETEEETDEDAEWIEESEGGEDEEEAPGWNLIDGIKAAVDSWWGHGEEEE